MATNCEFNNLLGRYHDGELKADQRGQFEQHLATCADCPAELRQMQAISQTLRAQIRPKASADFVSRLEGLSVNVEDVSVIRFVRRLTAVAAAILLVATLQLAMHTSPAVSSAVAVTTTPSNDEKILIDPAAAAKSALSDNSGNLLLAEAPDPLASEIAGGRP